MQPFAIELSNVIMNERRREAEQQRLTASSQGSEDGHRFRWAARIDRSRPTPRPVHKVAMQ